MECSDLDLLASLLDDDQVIPDEAALVASIRKEEASEIHKGDTDSSDDEDNKYFESSIYNSYGRSIKTKLAEESPKDRADIIRETMNNTSWKKAISNDDSPKYSKFCVPAKPSLSRDMYAEPVFGIRIINPVVSSVVIKEKMNGKVPIPLSRVKSHVAHSDLKTDWVIAGVIVSKSQPKVSQKGSKYMIWHLSDLKDKLLTVSLFLFGNSYNKLWKTNLGCVVGVLNPNVLNNKDKSTHEATLSIFDPDLVMIWGQSKDFGTCKGKKKNGENCTNFVNMNQCEFCIHHIQGEYKKFTGRSELQSPTGGLINLRNKVLGKNEVFYGGKSFSALTPPGKSKVQEKDKTRLTSLGVNVMAKASLSDQTPKLPHCPRTVELLKKLSETSDKNREDGAKSKTPDGKNENKNFSFLKNKISINDKKPSLLQNKLSFPSLSDPSMDKTSPKNNIPTKNLTKNPKSKNSLQSRFNALNSIVIEPGNNKSDFELDVVMPMGGITPLIQKKDIEKLPADLKCSRVEEKTSPKTEKPLKVSPKISHTPNRVKPPLSTEKSRDELLPTREESPKVVTSKPSKKTEITNLPERVQQKFPAITNNTGGTVMSAKSPPMQSLIKKTSARVSSAKKKALEYVRQNGPINNSDNTRKRTKRPLESGEEDDSETLEDKEKKFVLSERFIELMNRPPVNPELIGYNEAQKLSEYYDKMEKKEAMEEKMLSTYKLACKAVRCMKCKYTWFSSSELCKAEGHPIKVVDAEKRFFKCGQCGNRTVSLSIIPLISCRNCGSSNWLKAPMIKERINTPVVNLSIRGGEQKFMNSVITDANLDLLVAED